MAGESAMVLLFTTEMRAGTSFNARLVLVAVITTSSILMVSVIEGVCGSKADTTMHIKNREAEMMKTFFVI
jgi:hypothetical protein